jgi:hypothetical protein
MKCRGMNILVRVACWVGPIAFDKSKSGTRARLLREIFILYEAVYQAFTS